MAQTLQRVPAIIKRICFLYFQIDKLKILSPIVYVYRKDFQKFKNPPTWIQKATVSSRLALISHCIQKSLECIMPLIMPLDIPPVNICMPVLPSAPCPGNGVSATHSSVLCRFLSQRSLHASNLTQADVHNEAQPTQQMWNVVGVL